jgi:hypothetical protein
LKVIVRFEPNVGQFPLLVVLVKVAFNCQFTLLLGSINNDIKVDVILKWINFAIASHNLKVFTNCISH